MACRPSPNSTESQGCTHTKASTTLLPNYLTLQVSWDLLELSGNFPSVSVTFPLSQALAFDHLGFLCLSAFTEVFKVNYKAFRGEKIKSLALRMKTA